MLRQTGPACCSACLHAARCPLPACCSQHVFHSPTIARLTPVLPAVPSVMSPPGCRAPDACTVRCMMDAGRRTQTLAEDVAADGRGACSAQEWQEAVWSAGAAASRYCMVSSAQHSTAQPSPAQHSTAQPSPAQPSTAQPSTAQHSTAQHSTAQHSTAQHSTAQHSTAQHTTALTSASCRMRRATLSFTLPPGLRNSALPRICHNKHTTHANKHQTKHTLQQAPKSNPAGAVFAVAGDWGRDQRATACTCTSHPVASERLLMRIRGVLPMAPSTPSTTGPAGGGCRVLPTRLRHQASLQLLPGCRCRSCQQRPAATAAAAAAVAAAAPRQKLCRDVW